MTKLKDLIPDSLKKESKGLGDTIEKITEVTGIKKVVEEVSGKDCGCNKRKDKLNKMFPYKKWKK